MSIFNPKTPQEILIFRERMEKLLPQVKSFPLSGILEISSIATIHVHSHQDYPAVAFCCLTAPQIEAQFYVVVEGMTNADFIDFCIAIYFREEMRLKEQAMNHGYLH